MRIFAVIDVDQDYDYVNGLKCMGSFLTEEKANQYIKEADEKHKRDWGKREQYIDLYVSEIDESHSSYNEWKRITDKYYNFSGFIVSPENFKKYLKSYLMSHSVSKIEGYNPPEAYLKGNLFVIEIPYKEGENC